MLEVAINILKELEKSGYIAYIVGGFVRDKLLHIPSSDVDICTNATPKQLIGIFASCMPSQEYGSVTISVKNYLFAITTFRKELKYLNNRKPIEIEYISDLYQDLIRRDFTVNTICMNSKGEIIDLLNGQDDLKKKVIKTVGNPYDKMEEDCLRILRAVRFSTILDFELDQELKNAIIAKKFLLNKLSYERKKEELSRIFTSKNILKGIKLLQELELDKELELTNITKIKENYDLITIWAILDVSNKYPFTNNEKNIFKDITAAKKENILDPIILYKYKLYTCFIVGEINGINKKDILSVYNNMPISSRADINISTGEILSVLNIKAGPILKKIYNDLEKNILTLKLKNDKDDIKEYIKRKWGNYEK